MREKKYTTTNPTSPTWFIPNRTWPKILLEVTLKILQCILESTCQLKLTFANSVDTWSSWNEYGISATGNFTASGSEWLQPSCRLLLNILIGWKLILEVDGTGRLVTTSGGGATWRLQINKLLLNKDLCCHQNKKTQNLDWVGYKL